MKESYKKVCERLDREIEELMMKPDITRSDAELLRDMFATIKDAYEVDMYTANGGSSYGGDWMARGTYDHVGEHSQRNRKRDSMGRFSREGNRQGGGSYDDGSYRGGSSYGGEDSGVHELLEDAMEMATSERERSAIRRAIEEIRK